MEHSGGPCTGCGEREPVTSDGYCRECLQYRFGGDQEEALLVNAMMRGVVTSLLDASVPSELIVTAVHRALEEDRERQAKYLAGGGR